MTLIDWIKLQTTKDTLSLVKLAFKKPRTGTTPPDIKQEAREQWEVQKRKALRYVMTQAGIGFTDLQTALTVRNKIAVWVRGLPTVNDKTDMLATYIPVFWNAYIEFREIDVSSEDDEYSNYDAGSKPVWGDCPAVYHNWTDLINAPIPGDVIEAVQRG